MDDDPDFPPKRLTNPRAPIAFGYMIADDDPMDLVPNPVMVPYVKEALDFIDQGGSFRETAAWLTEKTGRSISHQGIAVIWRERRGSHPNNARGKASRSLKRKTAPKTGPEKAKAKIIRQTADAKRILTIRQKKLRAWVDLPKPVVEEPVVPKTVSETLDFTAAPAEREVVFKPNSGPQTEFLSAAEREVLYGGSAGGGKTYALIADPMRYFVHPQFNGIIFRRTNDELREIIWKSQEIYPRAFPGAKWQEKKSQWVFPNGGRLWMTYLERDEDVLRYQGQAFCVGRGTDILMADGSYKKIEDLVVGDEVQTIEGPHPVSFTSGLQRKKCVKVSVYDCDGHLVSQQLQPDTHPIALLSSEPCSQFHDLSRNVEQFRSSQIQWLSAEHLLSQSLESPVSVASLEDGQTDCTKSANGTQVSQQLQGSFYPAVLASLDPQLAQVRAATGYRTSCRSSQSSLKTDQETSSKQSGLQQNDEPDQLLQDRSTQPYEHASSHETYALPETQIAEGSKCSCSACSRRYDGSLQSDQAFDPDAAPLPNDAASPVRDNLRVDGMDCTPSRSRYLPSKYSHPYSLEPRDVRVQLELGIVHVEPIDEPLCDVFDITIIGPNSYISKGGLLNRNCYIAFDELTQMPTPFSWDYMRSRLRTTAPDLPIFMRATTNPGGPGHGWVKAMFIDPAPANKAFPATDISTGEVLAYPLYHEKAGQPLFSRRFIPASLYDNPYLSADGSYEANLLSLPENQRRQLLEGDWTVADGAAFTEFRTKTHVIEPYDIPPTWRRFRSCDYGYSSHSAVHWFAIDPNYETLVVYRELYVSKHTGRDLGNLVVQTERGESISYGVLDSSCWHQRGQVGPSIAEEMIAAGSRWRPSDRSAGARVAGKNRLHELLKVDPYTERPGIVFFNTCRQIIADLPVIPSDPRGGDDIDNRYASDHAYDSIRYGVMSRPRAFSPFDMGEGVPQRTWRPVDATFGY